MKHATQKQIHNRWEFVLFYSIFMILYLKKFFSPILYEVRAKSTETNTNMSEATKKAYRVWKLIFSLMHDHMETQRTVCFQCKHTVISAYSAHRHLCHSTCAAYHNRNGSKIDSERMVVFLSVWIVEYIYKEYLLLNSA